MFTRTWVAPSSVVAILCRVSRVGAGVFFLLGFLDDASISSSFVARLSGMAFGFESSWVIISWALAACSWFGDSLASHIALDLQYVTFGILPMFPCWSAWCICSENVLLT